MQRRATWRGVGAGFLLGIAACSPGGGGETALESGLVGTGGTGTDEAAAEQNAGVGESGGAAGEPAPMNEVGESAAGAAGTSPLKGPPEPPAQVDPGDAGDAGPLPADAGVDPEPPVLRDAGTDPSPGETVDAGGSVPALDPLVAQRYAALSARLAALATRTASFWLEHGPDPTFGGFHAALDRQGNPIAPTDKGLIQQARQLWTLATWYERREPTPAMRAQAELVYDFLQRSFLDPADGAFVYKVSRDGTRVVDGKKQLFAESYAIYALATYGRVFGEARATALALDRFTSIDASHHDATNGGYDQRTDPGTLSAGAEKDTNTHLHLMEAFGALYEATLDPRVGARLNELVDLFATRLRQPSGYVHAEFKLDWTIVGAPRVSFGHDLETSWLLLDAARVLGRNGDGDLRAAALAIADRSARAGFDAQSGGYFEAGPVTGAADDRDKVWWVQFEAMEGLWWAYELDPQQLYLERLSRTLDWIELAEDLPVGEWFATTNADGSAAGADYKADEWKDAYHPVRALVFLQDWIDAELGPGAAP